jgi:hypothetical protein
MNRPSFYQKDSPFSDIEILITLSYGEGGIWAEEFVGEEDNIVGLVFGFEPVATDGAP